MSDQKLILLVGPSAAGKSTFAEKYIRENPDTLYLSSDQLRKDLTGDENNQTVNGQVFGIIKSRTDENLKNGKSVLIDAMGLNPKDRKDHLALAAKYNVPCIAYVFERTKEQLVKNQEKRASKGGRRVPDDVIDRMLQKYVRPSHGEGFSLINMV